ncbi:hypothetical protein PSACC_00971 [Paramicrosporidium saccamoebae]|uniref:Uncharacterized protein n=1 Tax=Paramicrosporidium saccamoebae TaxID=1246581 RepID=A0A2H9TND3_9FUNG|nr:hypothetical protein PSACC_00971 [Paramicrosporidium saccamoebae]
MVNTNKSTHASLASCLTSAEEFLGDRRWFSGVKFLACLVVLFGGPVVAANAAAWSFAVGGALPCAAIGVLVGRRMYTNRQQAQLVGRLTELCPDATIWEASMGFYPALSVSYGVPVFIYRLLVFTDRLMECQQLSFEDFKAECLRGMSFYTMDDFGRNAALLLFVETSQLKECREWLIEAAVLWEVCSKIEDEDELICAIRYIWHHDVFSQDIRSSFTFHAVRKMTPESKEGLCQALRANHKGDAWIAIHFPEPSNINNDTEAPSTDDTPYKPSNVDSAPTDPEASVLPNEEKNARAAGGPIGGIRLERWSSMGKYMECRFCRYRPPKSRCIPSVIYKAMKHMYPWALRCGKCGCGAMRFGRVSDVEG